VDLFKYDISGFRNNVLKPWVRSIGGFSFRAASWRAIQKATKARFPGTMVILPSGKRFTIYYPLAPILAVQECVESMYSPEERKRFMHREELEDETDEQLVWTIECVHTRKNLEMMLNYAKIDRGIRIFAVCTETRKYLTMEILEGVKLSEPVSFAELTNKLEVE